MLARWPGVLPLVTVLVWSLPLRAQEAWNEDAALKEEDDAGEREDDRALKRRHFDDQAFVIGALFGFGTFVGLGGLTAGYSLHDRVEIGGGVGSNAEGVMGGGYLRVRPVVGMRRKSGQLHAFSLDLGLSVGPYSEFAGGLFGAMSHTPAHLEPRYRADSTTWLQVEGAWETRNKDGLTLRLGLGFAGLLNPGAIECESFADGPSCGEPVGFVPVYVVGLGYAL